jgi:hypothetical protein
LNEANLDEVEAWIGSLGHAIVYVVFSRSMAAYAGYFGYPRAYTRLANAVRSSTAWRVVYRNSDVVIYYRVTRG